MTGLSAFGEFMEFARVLVVALAACYCVDRGMKAWEKRTP